MLHVGRRSVRAALVCSLPLVTLLVGIGQRPAAAAVTSVRGEACSYYVNVGLFGGPQTLLGCNEGETSDNKGQSRPPQAGTNLFPTDTSYSPHVRISGSGGDQTAIDDNGAKGVYGPATIHGGKWPCEDPGTDPNGDGVPGNCPETPPPSGPQRAATSGSAASGTVSASAEIKLDTRPTSQRQVDCWEGWGPICVNEGGFGPFPVSGDQLNVQCTANESGVSGSATFVNAELALSTDAEGNPVEFEDVPDNPPPNYTRHGVITNVGDVFSVVYNEQIKNSDGSLTVIGTHMYLMGPTAVGELVRGKVTCGVTPNSVVATDTVAPTCGTPVVRPMGPEDPTPQVPRTELVGTFDAGIGNVRQVTDAATTAGSRTVTSATASFQASDVNGPVFGTGIPVNAYITAVNSATSVQISHNALTSGSGRPLTITRPQGIQSVTNIQVLNGTVNVGDPDSFFNYLKFNPGQTGPLPVVATRTEESLPMYWSFDVTDMAGNTSHCRGVIPAPSPVAFHPLPPARILDSRPPPNQVGPFNSPWGAGQIRDVRVAGGTGPVPANAAAVVLNVTVTGTTAHGYLTMWPAGQSQPLASSLNWAPGNTIPNAVTVKVGTAPAAAAGKVSVFNAVGNANVIIDVVGYYDSLPGDGFTSLTPARISDSRPPPNQVGPFGSPWGAAQTRDVTVAGGAGGVPLTADAVVLNVTVTNTTAHGYLTIWPAGLPKPTASSLNWAPGQTIPNAVTVKVGTGGKISVFNAVGSADVIVDVVGYFAAGSGALFYPGTPGRLQDSRPGAPIGPYSTPWGPDQQRDVQVWNRATPPGASAALLNVTVTGTTAPSFLTIWPAGQPAPLASSLNWAAGQTIPNAVTTKLSATGAISVKNASGNVHVLADIAGWYA